MNKSLRYALGALRIGLGVYFLYAGVSKIMDPSWSAAGYLNAAKTFPGLFQWFALPANIGWVNFLNEWGLTLIGVALVTGIAVRWTSKAAIALMVLYYLPILDFPYVGERAWLVDDHIIFIAAFLVLLFFQGEQSWSLERFAPKFLRDK
ncbi:MAG: DoxX family protein [Patescibacteria group bacterium]